MARARSLVVLIGRLLAKLTKNLPSFRASVLPSGASATTPWAIFSQYSSGTNLGLFSRSWQDLHWLLAWLAKAVGVVGRSAWACDGPWQLSQPTFTCAALR